jgi:hypothetical protein
MILELTAPNGSPFTVRFEDDVTCMLEVWMIQTPNNTTIPGSRLTIAGFGNIVVQEEYEDLKERIFKPKLATVTQFRKETFKALGEVMAPSETRIEPANLRPDGSIEP